MVINVDFSDFASIRIPSNRIRTDRGMIMRTDPITGMGTGTGTRTRRWNIPGISTSATNR